MRVDELLEKIDEEVEFPISKKSVLDRFGDVEIENQKSESDAKGDTKGGTLHQVISQKEQIETAKDHQEKPDSKDSPRESNTPLYGSSAQLRNDIDAGLREGGL